MAAAKTILVLEEDEAVRIALGRIHLGRAVDMEFTSPAEIWEKDGDYVGIFTNDFALLGAGEKLPLTVLKEKFRCPIILMTASGNARIEGYAKEHGADGVLFKPFGLAELRKHLRSLAAYAEVTGENTDESNIQRTTDYDSGVLPDSAGRIAEEQAFDNLFHEIEKRQPLPEELDAFDVIESHLIKRALQTCGGNQSKAAKFLGITRNTLRKRIRKYGFGYLLAGDEQQDIDDK